MTDLTTTENGCADCGTEVLAEEAGARCPVCFERYLYSLDVGFLDSYRKFGCKSPAIVAETCLRGLVLAAPEHRKILASTIFQQYIQAMTDLAGLFTALRERSQAPILKSFSEFRLDANNAVAFYEAVQSVNDLQLCAALELPAPVQVAEACPHLDEVEAYQVAVAIYHLVQDLRKATDRGGPAAEALAQLNQNLGSALISENARWMTGVGPGLSPDQVAMLVLDARKQAFTVQGLSADERVMEHVVDAITTVTRASSNLIFAYLQTNNL